MQQVAANSDPPPPNPTALVQVVVVAGEEIQAPSWAQPILKFLVNRELPADQISARQVQRRAGAYMIVNRELVRRSVTGVFQQCVDSEKGQAILKDIHQGECGHHAASRSLVAKAFRHGFFWPTALEDAKELVKHCKGCPKFSSKQHIPAFALKTIPLMLPFVLSTKTSGPSRSTRGLPFFIYMICFMPMNVLFHSSAWHQVRPVGPGACHLVLCRCYMQSDK